jgi:exopolysaccharide biosynthesis polyprenyl glycosylphosphotransferase
MNSNKRKLQSSAMKVLDLTLLMISFAVAALPRVSSAGMPMSLEQFLEIKIKLHNFLVFALLLWVWHLFFSMLGLYGSKRMSPRRAEVRDIVKATLGSAVVLMAASVFLGFRMVTFRFVVVFWVTSTVLCVSTRLLIRAYLLRARAHGHDTRNMLIIGTNSRAIELAKLLESKPELGYRILGFADDEWPGIDEIKKTGLSVLCDLTNLRNFVRRNVVDEIVLAMPLRSFHDLSATVATMCEEQGIILRLRSDLFNLKTRRAIADEFEESALITHYTTIEDGWPMVIKRGLDIVVSILLIILLAPAQLLISLLVKLTSPGPILFMQKRVGLNKRTFHIYKFRTMSVNAEEKLREIEHLNEVSGPVFKIKNDPRLTPIGKFLRRTSIDELPQLFNVLKGDMSLVGPRPLQLRDYELFTQTGEDWQRCRFSVRPGITCLWQVNGRNALPFQKWMELDLQYVRNWSLWLDLQILARTIPAVLRGSGAA